MTSLTDLYDHHVRRPPATTATATTATTASGVRQPGRAATATVRERELEEELRTRRRLVADTSHDLRNPLAGLRTELEEARLHPDQTNVSDLVDRTLRNLDRIDAIAVNLLLLSRSHTGLPDRPRHFDLSGFVRTEIAHRDDAVTTHLHLEPGITVRAVPGHLTRILTNLLDNAQRHAAHAVHVDLGHDAHHAVLSVTDDGDGIAEEDHERVFRRFTRLPTARTRDQHGAGLGLAISRDLAHAHGGTLQAGTSPAGGARFTLRLPLSRPPATGATPPAAA